MVSLQQTQLRIHFEDSPDPVIIASNEKVEEDKDVIVLSNKAAQKIFNVKIGSFKACRDKILHLVPNETLENLDFMKLSSADDVVER